MLRRMNWIFYMGLMEGNFWSFWMFQNANLFFSNCDENDKQNYFNTAFIYSESFIFFTFCFYSYKMVSENLTSLLLTCGKWSIFLVKVKAKVLVLTTTLFFFRNFYIFLVYIKLIVNRNSYVMKIKTKRSTWYKLKIYRNFWKKRVWLSRQGP